MEANHANLIAADTKDSNEEILRLLTNIALRGSDGVILQGCPNPDFDGEAFGAAIDLLKSKQIPVIVIDYGYGLNDLCCAVMNEAEVGRIAARHFAQMGHTQVCAVCIAGDGLSEERFRGFREVAPDCFRINTGSTLPEDLVRAEQHGITAFFCYNDPLARECMEIFRHAGISVPDHVSVMGVDDTEIARFTNMTSIAHPKHQLGKYAAKEILSRSDPRTKVFDPSLVQRNSVKPFR